MKITTACLCILLGTMAGRADAVFVLNINQVGGNIVATGSGSLNIDGASPVLVEATATSNISSFGVFLGGLQPRSQAIDVTFRETPIFVDSFRYDTQFGSGDRVGFVYSTLQLFGVLVVPDGYASGTALSTTNTFQNIGGEYAGLRLGTFVFDYVVTASGAADTIIVQVGPAAVPEPASFALLALSLCSCGVGMTARRRIFV